MYNTIPIFKSFQRAKSTATIIKDINDINGIESITPQEKLQVEKLIENLDAALKKAPLRTPAPRASIPTVAQCLSETRKTNLKPLNTRSMIIMFTNADQLTSSKIIELKKKIQDEKPLIVAVSEVKSKNSAHWSIDDNKIPSYSLHPVNFHTTTDRGIAVYSHESLSKSVSQIKPPLNFEETCLLEIRLRGGDLLLLACCYRSPTPSESSNQNNEKLNRLLRCIEKKN